MKAETILMPKLSVFRSYAEIATGYFRGFSAINTWRSLHEYSKTINTEFKIRSSKREAYYIFKFIFGRMVTGKHIPG